MDPIPDRRVIMDDSLESVTVVDVYDQAAGIGKEFEKLIENYGVDAVTDLMPKVIKALEQLESLAGRYEKESSEISELRYTIDKLETEKQERSQERLRYEEVCFCKYMNSRIHVHVSSLAYCILIVLKIFYLLLISLCTAQSSTRIFYVYATWWCLSLADRLFCYMFHQFIVVSKITI